MKGSTFYYLPLVLYPRLTTHSHFSMPAFASAAGLAYCPTVLSGLVGNTRVNGAKKILKIGRSDSPYMGDRTVNRSECRRLRCR
eukprot:21174-Pleurochrysis_carterae.AAC.1